jgi:hypothetical protein
MFDAELQCKNYLLGSVKGSQRWAIAPTMQVIRRSTSRRRLNRQMGQCWLHRKLQLPFALLARQLLYNGAACLPSLEGKHDPG